jgi:hypothetical protein
MSFNLRKGYPALVVTNFNVNFFIYKEIKSMKHRFLITFATFAVVFALLAVFAASTLAKGGSPLKASFAGSAGFTSPTTGEYNGTGKSTFLGKSQVHGEIQVTGAPSCEGGFTATHNDTITAANGDKLYMQVTEDACPTAPGAFRCIGTYMITGGTGEFSQATGTGVFEGDVDFAQGKFQLTYSGLYSEGP